MQATIKEAKRNRFVKTGEQFLDVTVDFIEDGEVKETRKLGYPLGTSAEDVKEDLAKAVATFETEKEQKVVQKEVDATDEQAKEVIEELEGETVDITFKRKKRKTKKASK